MSRGKQEQRVQRSDGLQDMVDLYVRELALAEGLRYESPLDTSATISDMVRQIQTGEAKPTNESRLLSSQQTFFFQ